MDIGYYLSPYLMNGHSPSDEQCSGMACRSGALAAVKPVGRRVQWPGIAARAPLPQRSGVARMERE